VFERPNPFEVKPLEFRRVKGKTGRYAALDENGFLRVCWSRFHRSRGRLRRRESVFVNAFFKRMVPAMDTILQLRTKRERAYCWQRLACLAIVDAGYYEWRGLYALVKGNGELTTAGDRRSRYLLTMPRIQAAIDQKFTEAGLSMERCAQIVSNIAEGRGEDVTPDHQLRAIDMRIRATVGYAPTKSIGVQQHLGKDQFFDPEAYEKTPPIETEMIESEGV
jgi:hypothetical protein